MINTNLLEQNWSLFRKLCEKTGERSESILRMADSLGERIIMCPAFDKSEHLTCRPGGLMEYSLATFKNLRALTSTFDEDISLESIIIVSLFHNIGKIGDPDGEPYFIEQDSQWHREKLGQLYKYNPDIAKMTHPHRSLFILQRYNIALTDREWVAILTSGGQGYDENKFYNGLPDRLTFFLQTASHMSNLSFKAENQ